MLRHQNILSWKYVRELQILYLLRVRCGFNMDTSMVDDEQSRQSLEQNHETPFS